MDITYVIMLFFHLAGIIIALGAVTVIDTLGFLGRNSVKWTATTIQAHYVTKALIWVGTILMALSWFFMLQIPIEGLQLYKSLIILILIANGCFLSFYISPRLTKHASFKPGELLPITLKDSITVSFVLSFLGWWSLVALTVISISVI